MKRILITLMTLIAILSPAVARDPERGYRGFIDWSNSLRSEDPWGNGNRQTYILTGASTSHGYQFNRWIYAGAGLDYERKSIDREIIALFVDGRTDLRFGRYTPFGDIRIGWSMNDGGGVYFSPSIGYRFSWGRKFGINLGLGLTVKGYSTDIYDITEDPSNGYEILIKTGTYHGTTTYFSFRLGFDF